MMNKRKFQSPENIETHPSLNPGKKQAIKAIKYNPQLPTALWLHISTFLSWKDFLGIRALNREYLYLFLLWASKRLKKTVPDIYQSFTLNTEISPMTWFRQFQDLQREHASYYTLFQKNYISLFVAIKKYDVDKAQDFIRDQLLLSQSIEKESVIDMVFYQKDANGDSVITLAQRLGLQDFLDFCFEELILKFENLNQTEYSLIFIGNADSVLQAFATSGMSSNLLWLYACAYVCEQTQFCRNITEHKYWDKTWVSTARESLLLFSTLLGSTRLAQYVMEDTLPSVQKALLCRSPEYDDKTLYCNYNITYGYPMRIAAISKNIAMIRYLKSFSFLYQQISFPYWQEKIIESLDELLSFCIEFRDLHGVQECLSLSLNPESHSMLFPKHLGVASMDDNVLSPVSLAVAKNWREGLELLLLYGAAINGKCDDSEMGYHSVSVAVTLGNMEMARLLLENGADSNGFDFFDLMGDCPAPIICAIHEGSLDFVKLLLEFNASIVTQRSIVYDDHEYPLVEAIYFQQEKIANYLLMQLKPADALAQLEKAGERLIKREYFKEVTRERLIEPAFPKAQDRSFLLKIKTMQESLTSQSSSPRLFAMDGATQPDLLVSKTNVNDYTPKP